MTRTIFILAIALIAAPVLATVADTYAPTSFNCNGSTTQFNVTAWGVTSTAEVVVTYVDAGGEPNELNLTTDYSVTRTGNTYTTGFKVTTVDTYASGAKIIVSRATEISQDRTGTALAKPAQISLAADKLTTILQELQEQIKRCFRLPIEAHANDANVPWDTSQYVVIDANGNVDTVAYSDSLSDPQIQALADVDPNAGDIPYFTTPTTMSSFPSTSFTRGIMDAVDPCDFRAEINAQRKLVFDVNEYGAEGDGATDDSAAIQAAIDAAEVAGGDVFFPAGTYIIGASLTVTADGITLSGVPGKTILQAKASTAGVNVVTGADISNFTMRNIIIDGNRANNVDGASDTVQNGVLITNDSAAESNLVFENVTVRNCYSDGIRAEAADGMVTTGVVFVRCSVDTTDRGLRTDYCGQVSLRDCTTNDTESGAIYLDQVHDGVLVSGCDINDVGGLQNGIFVRGAGPTVSGGGAAVADDCNGVRIEANYLNDDGDGGFAINTSGYVQQQTISGNVIRGDWTYDGISANQGFLVDPNTGEGLVTITGNVVSDVDQYSISARSTKHAVIQGNICRGSGSGIFIGGRDTNNVTVLGNQCYDHTNYGIYVNDCNQAVVSGNSCWGNTSGIYARSAEEQCLIDGNYLYNNSQYGINIQDTMKNVVVGVNYYSNNTTADLYDEGATAITTGLMIYGNKAAAASLALKEDTDNGTSKITLIAPALAGDVTLTLPIDDGGAGEALTTDGSGVLSWSAAGAGAGDITSVGPGAATGAALTDGVVTSGTTMFVWEGTTANANQYNWVVGAADPAAAYTYTWPELTGTVTMTTNKLSVFAATTSAELMGVLSDEQGTGVLVGSNSPTFVDDITVAAAGVKLTGANGMLTILGLGDGQDEDIKLDLNTTANTLTITSPASSLDKIDATGITITATGFVGALTGNASGTAATVTGAAQANITSVGALTGLTMAGIIADNDDMVFEVDADNNGTHKYSFTDGASGEAASITEAGVLYTKSNIELGHATDTTISRSAAGAVQVEGLQVLLSGHALTGDVTATMDTDGSTATAIADSVTVTGWALGTSTATQLTSTTVLVGAAGDVSLTTDTDGMLIMAGASAGEDEDLRWNLDDIADTVTVTSGTGVNLINFSGVNLQATTFTGALTGKANTAGTADVATAVTITDNESEAENDPLVFVAGGDLDGGNLGLESDGTTYYTPSTGVITATGFAGAFTGALTGNADTATTAGAGDAALNFFGAGVTAVTDATACTDLEGVGLVIDTAVLKVATTEIEATTWGAGGNASNVWTSDLSGTDTTLTWGSGLVTFSHDVTVSGGDIVLGSTSIFSGGDTASLNNIDAIDATTETTLEAAIDTLGSFAEGGLADSTVVSADIKDGVIAGADLATNLAITSTGAQDFGGATSVEIPNGTNPTVDAAGEIAQDTDGANEAGDVSIRAFDGTNTFMVERKLKTFQATIIKPQDLADATRDLCPIWSNNTGMTFTITEIRAWSPADDTTLNVEVVTATNFSSPTLIDALDCATDGTSVYTDTETTISDATVAHDEILTLDFDNDDDPGWVKVEITGWFNAAVD